MTEKETNDIIDSCDHSPHYVAEVEVPRLITEIWRLKSLIKSQEWNIEGECPFCFHWQGNLVIKPAHELNCVAFTPDGSLK